MQLTALIYGHPPFGVAVDADADAVVVEVHFFARRSVYK